VNVVSTHHAKAFNNYIQDLLSNVRITNRNKSRVKLEGQFWDSGETRQYFIGVEKENYENQPRTRQFFTVTMPFLYKHYLRERERGRRLEHDRKDRAV
jgi:hypothetical protein